MRHVSYRLMSAQDTPIALQMTGERNDAGFRRKSRVKRASESENQILRLREYPDTRLGTGTPESHVQRISKDLYHRLYPQSSRMQRDQWMQSYRAFLLRCWPAQATSPDAPTAWRFSLEEVGPERQPLGFVSLEALMTYISTELNDGLYIRASQPATPPEDGDPHPADENVT